MRVVGLTGGIGSGKSTVAELLRARGLPVVDADAVARDCVRPGTPVLAAVVARFGAGVLDATGALDRRALADVVFHDAGARRDLEALTHPCIAAGVAARLAELASADRPPELAFVEHPLLVEAGRTGDVDVVVVVEAPEPDRVDRVVAARGMSAADVRARIAAQADDAVRRAAADHVLTNDGDLEALARAVDALLPLLAGGTGGRGPA